MTKPLRDVLPPAPAATSTVVRRTMQAVPRAGTRPEMALRRAVHRRGLRYRVGQKPIPELRRTADLVFKGARVAVFLDGCFWHGCSAHTRWPRTNEVWWRQKIERTRLRDRDTDRLLLEQGWLPVRIWEHDPVEEAAATVEAIVRSRRPEVGIRLPHGRKRSGSPA